MNFRGLLLCLFTLTTTLTSADEIRKSARIRQHVTADEQQHQIQAPRQGRRQGIEIQIERHQQQSADAKSATGQAKVIILGPGTRKELNFPLDSADDLNQLAEELPESVGQLPVIQSIFKQMATPDTRTVAAGPGPQPVLGISCEPPSSALKKHLRLRNAGLLITSVMPGSPAAEAGLQTDDLLLKVGDSLVAEMNDLIDLVQKSEGEELNLTLLHEGEERVVNVTPRTMNVPELPAIGEAFRGMPQTTIKGLQLPEELAGKIRKGEIMMRRLQEAPVIAPDQEAAGRNSLQGQVSQLQKQLKKLQQDVNELKAELAEDQE